MDNLDNLRLLCESVRWCPERPKKLVRIYIGGKEGILWRAMRVVIRALAKRLDFDFEYFCSEDIQSLKMTERQFVNFFLESDCHFILGHAHQGLRIGSLRWNMEHLQSQSFAGSMPILDFPRDNSYFVQLSRRTNLNTLRPWAIL